MKEENGSLSTRWIILNSMKRTVIILIFWIAVGLIGSSTIQSHNFALFSICALVFPVLTLILMYKIIGTILDSVRLLFTAKKKQEISDDPFIEQITLDHPDYIGIVTKIDKKKYHERKRN